MSEFINENDTNNEDLAADTPEISSEYSDVVLSCRDCVSPFTFTAGEQAWYSAHNFAPPARCNRCRAENKRQQGLTGLRPGTGALGIPPRQEGLVYPEQVTQGFNMQQRRPATGPLGSYGGQPNSRSLSYRTHCRRCGSEAFVPYSGTRGMGGSMPLCRSCREHYDS